MSIKNTLVVAVLALGIGTALAQPAQDQIPDPDSPTADKLTGEPPAERPGADLGGHVTPAQVPVPAATPKDVDVDDKTGGNTVGEHGKRALGPGEVYADADHTKHFNWFGFSYSGKDQYGGKFGDGQVLDHDGNVVIDPHTGAPLEEEAMSAPFILMIVNFLILMGILLWKGKPIAGKLASERHDLIKNALDEAAKLREQAAKKLEEYETKLKDADAEIKAMVDGMKKDAEADKARILENAERQSAQMKKDAESRIAAEIELARASLTREVTAAASLATEKLLRDKMLPTDQQKLVASFITDVSATPAAKERV